MLQTIKNQVRLWNEVTKLVNFQKNRKFLQYMRKLSEMDSIRDFDRFAEAVEPFVRQTLPVDYSAYGYESYYYGYYDELMHYAGVKPPRVPVFPRMEHGIRFGGAVWSLDANALAYACQGLNRAEEIWSRDSAKMVFGLGPYIHYAREYYSEEAFREIKETLGKTLLVFPSHTAEGMDTRPDEENFVKIVYEKYAPHFDSVVVCAYWRDAKTPVIQAFREKGARIVSAGYRGDRNFIRRLKTLIRLCDAAVGDAIGTNIGFCQHLDRPYYLERINKNRGTDTYYEENQDRLFAAFSSEDLTFTEAQLQQQQQLFTDFWGGKTAVYTPEEANRLIRMVIELCREANYRADRLPKVIEQKLQTISKEDPRYPILANAVKIVK